ncbi:hypothetical protein ACFSUS_21410 [Spirosoma soli]|uniref:Uncharacterized protein n=1 Tax=Spirosoma soli TaxID=1770529 RepID=A0ABW5M8B8_9BACT
MKTSIVSKIDLLRNQSASQAEFMRKLAELDAKGPLSADLLSRINGGQIEPVKGGVTWGMRPPEPDSTIKF